MPDPGWRATLLARLVWASRIVDKAYGRFDRLRTRVVMRHAPDGFFETYNDIAFSRQARYRPESEVFEQDLFVWEQEAVDRWFPPPPARVLIGGVGGGREGFALARRGYAVTAFEPARDLVRGMVRRAAAGGAAMDVYEGRYESLPEVTAPDGSGRRVDLSRGAPFDAAIFGWASYSHLRTDRRRVDALRAMGRLTHGPILLSYFPFHASRQTRQAAGSFALFTGYFRDLTEGEVRAQAAEAGLDVVWLLHDTGWPRAILRRRDSQ
jgi:hypothetical protein